MKKKLIACLSAMLSLSVFATVSVFNINKGNQYSSTLRASGSNEHVLRIDSSTPFSISSGQLSELTVHTVNGNPIVFDGMNIQAKEGSLCFIPVDTIGCYSTFIQNRTPIDGMVGFKVTFSDADISDTLFVEWVNSATGAVDSDSANHNEYVDISKSLVKNPTYLKFNSGTDMNGDSGMAITSIEFYYTCIPTIHNEWPDYLEAEIIDGEAYISKFIGLNAGTRIIRIPEYYLGYPVVGIKDANVFKGNYSVGYVEFPSTFKSIPKDAFRECSRLYGVKTHNIQTIGYGAFYRCYQLSSFDFGSSLETIGDFAFYECGMSGQVTFPSTMISVGESAFNYTNVTSFVVYTDVTFGSNNPSLILHKNVKTGVDMLSGVYGVTDTNIYKYNLDANSSFDYVKYDVGDGESIAIVSSSILSGASIVLPSDIDGLTITYIAPHAFDNSRIKEIVLPFDVMYLGNYAFYYSSLTLFRSYEGLKMIGTYCFAQNYYSSRVTSFYLSSKSLKHIGNYAFRYVATTIYFDGEDSTASMPVGWKYSISSINIVTNYTYPGPYDYSYVEFVLSENTTVDVYHNNQMTFVSKERYKDYIKDLETGAASITGVGSILIKVHCNDSSIDESNFSFSKTGASITCLGDNVFAISGLKSFCKITIIEPYVPTPRLVTLVLDGGMSPSFYSDPSTKTTTVSGLTHYATDNDGNITYDDTGMVAFKINPGQYKKPSFTADNISGVYSSFAISRDVVTIYGVDSDLTITLEEVDDFYNVQFVYDEGIEKIIVYPTQDYTVEGEVTDSTVTRNPGTGVPASEYSYSKPQVNFEYVLKEGYSLYSMYISPSSGYKNNKVVGTNIRRVTVITCDLTITITTTANS